ncbi:hypothetical protein IC582_029736 [Cucumis melo]
MNNFTTIVVIASRSGTPPMAAENLQNLDGRVKSPSNNQLQASTQTLQACGSISVRFSGRNMFSPVIFCTIWREILEP